MMKKVIYLAVFLLLHVVAIGQEESFKQKVRGNVEDIVSGKVIPNALIELLNYAPAIADNSDKKGTFLLEEVPTGQQLFRVSADGYYETIVSQRVEGGKELILKITLVERVTSRKETDKSDRFYIRNNKLNPVDGFNTVSTKRFDIEDVTKYAGAWSDPARMVTNFPGLINIDDTQNYIVSRGNSPQGIRWLIEGIPIDNPHHFAILGNTGAILPLINNNILADSDFLNGAMPAHYSDAYSGVFDIRLRAGNNQKYEFGAQVSLYGAELTAEGPFKKGGASFIVTYRYGLFNLFQLLQLDLGTNSIPDYHDLNFKIDIPTKTAGTFSIFGIGGLSSTAVLDASSDTSDLFAERNIDLYLRSNIGVVGLTHKQNFDQHYLRTTLSYDIKDYHSNRDTILLTGAQRPYQASDELMQRVRLAADLKSKMSSRLTLRNGLNAYVQWMFIDNRLLANNERTEFADDIIVRTEAYSEIEYKISEKVKVIGGLQGYYWSLNDESWGLEPRLAVNWDITKKHQLNFGYGWHSKIQPLSVVFDVYQRLDGLYNDNNRDLGPTRGHHLICSYTGVLSRNWIFRSNLYGMYYTNIPVEQIASSFSMINYGAFAVYPRVPNLKNEGLAFNYGLDVSLEKFVSEGYYGLVSVSYTRSHYQGSDKVWRNSAFDFLYVAQLVGGKEFKMGKLKLNRFYFDLRFNTHGGQPYVPIALEESKLAGVEVRDTDNAYTERLNPYYRVDVRLGVRFNHKRKKISHHFYLEAINVGAVRNDLDIKYDPDSERIIRSKQFGFIPNFYYQVRF